MPANRKAPSAPYRVKTTPRKTRPPHVAQDTAIIERRADALSLRRAGASYRMIAKRTGVSVETAYSDVQAELMALRTVTETDAAVVRDIELRRLDDYTLALTDKARRGDVPAILTLLRVQDRRAKYLGLDAPSKQTVTGADGGPVRVVFGGRYKPEHE